MSETDERRAGGKLIAHWRRVRRDTALPSLHDMALDAHTGIRDASFLLLIGDAPADSVIVLCGERVEYEDLRTALGQTLSAMRRTVLRDALYRLCREATTERRPACLAGTFRYPRGPLARYRLCCVPLRADNAPVPAFSYVLGSFARKFLPNANGGG